MKEGHYGVVGSPPAGEVKLLMDRLPRKVKRHFLESELKTANDLIDEFWEHSGLQLENEGMDSFARHKLIWLLERLQESVL